MYTQVIEKKRKHAGNPNKCELRYALPFLVLMTKKALRTCRHVKSGGGKKKHCSSVALVA